jgi:hypothetical protein
VERARELEEPIQPTLVLGKSTTIVLEAVVCWLSALLPPTVLLYA